MKDGVKRFQNRVLKTLAKELAPSPVKKEWKAFKESQIGDDCFAYCPRLDIAVGPLNNKQEIKEATSKYKPLIAKLLVFSETPEIKTVVFLKKVNKKPRCFIAIEIGKTGSRKHMLGDIVNASFLGAIGIVVAYDKNKLRQYLRIKKYVERSFSNVLIIEKNKFKQAIREGVR